MTAISKHVLDFVDRARAERAPIRPSQFDDAYLSVSGTPALEASQPCAKLDDPTFSQAVESTESPEPAKDEFDIYITQVPTYPPVSAPLMHI